MILGRTSAHCKRAIKFWCTLAMGSTEDFFHSRTNVNGKKHTPVNGQALRWNLNKIIWISTAVNWCSIHSSTSVTAAAITINTTTANTTADNSNTRSSDTVIVIFVYFNRGTLPIMWTEAEQTIGEFIEIFVLVASKIFYDLFRSVGTLQIESTTSGWRSSKWLGFHEIICHVPITASVYKVAIEQNRS